jgi:hypothetical protein
MALRHLRLKGYPIGNVGLLELTKSSLAKQLETLEIGQDTTLSGKGLAALFDRQKWPRLEHLELMPVGASAQELAPLMSSDRFASLKIFHLYADGATPDTAERFAANPHTARLVSLALTGRNIGDMGIAALMRSPHLTQLIKLGLSGPDVSEATLLQLANPAVFPKLQALSISGIRTVSEVAEAMLRKRFGDQFEFVLYENIGT